MYKKIFQKYKIVSKKYNNNFDISKHYLFELLLNKRLNYRSYIRGIPTNFLLYLLSIISIIFAKFRRINTVNYFVVIKNSNGYYDFRSKYILKHVDMRKTLNLIRCNSFLDSLLAYLRYPNVVFYLPISFFSKPFFDIKFLSSEKKYQAIHKAEKKTYSVLKNIFSFLSIKKVITIDDQRVFQIFLRICKENKIKSIAYMHYKFTKYVVAMSLSCFDYFFVWSNYFKKKLIKVNDNYKKKKILITGCEKKNFLKKNSSHINVLYLIDLNISFNKISKKLFFISKIDNVNLMVKLKPQMRTDIQWLNFLKKNNFVFFTNETLEEINNIYNVHYFICTISTALLEAPIYAAIPIKIKTKNDFIDDILEDNIVYIANNNKELKKYLSNFPDKFFLKRIFSKIWGNKKYQDKDIKKKISAILNN